MYKSIFIITFLLNNSLLALAQTEPYSDSRDNQEYKTVKIGEQIWFAENLNYEMDDSWWYKDKKSIGKKHGRLYSWEAAMNACPEGWHLPTDKEWEKLIENLDGKKKAGHNLKVAGTSGFNARFSGFKDSENEAFYDFGNDANFWAATSLDKNDAWRCYIDRGYDDIVQDYFGKNGGLSVRCIKD